MQGRGENVAPRGNPPASGIVQHDSHVRKSGSEPAGYRARITVSTSQRLSLSIRLRLNGGPLVREVSGRASGVVGNKDGRELPPLGQYIRWCPALFKALVAEAALHPVLAVGLATLACGDHSNMLKYFVVTLEEIWAALKSQVLRADGGDWSSAGMRKSRSGPARKRTRFASTAVSVFVITGISPHLETVSNGSENVRTWMFYNRLVYPECVSIVIARGHTHWSTPTSSCRTGDPGGFILWRGLPGRNTRRRRENKRKEKHIDMAHSDPGAIICLAMLHSANELSHPGVATPCYPTLALMSVLKTFAPNREYTTDMAVVFVPNYAPVAHWLIVSTVRKIVLRDETTAATYETARPSGTFLEMASEKCEVTENVLHSGVGSAFCGSLYQVACERRRNYIRSPATRPEEIFKAQRRVSRQRRALLAAITGISYSLLFPDAGDERQNQCSSLVQCSGRSDWLELDAKRSNALLWKPLTEGRVCIRRSDMRRCSNGIPSATTSTHIASREPLTTRLAGLPTTGLLFPRKLAPACNTPRSAIGRPRSSKLFHPTTGNPTSQMVCELAISLCPPPHRAATIAAITSIKRPVNKGDLLRIVAAVHLRSSTLFNIALTIRAGMKGRGKREIPDKTRRPTASSCTIPTCENPE
ncbi:hypothetical protein PR048_026901 [Dryococelus australis]|uniref:Uncharacterized protein n=1 Tax=Dryococelus australis TaxID=614101 RepID=A0ABQ9GMK3_9NEOP|nr:hypothetical protein PR048_026901 [Dryococelus australis]